MAKQQLQVGLGERSYVITIGQGTLDRVGEIVGAVRAGKRYGIISDATVDAIYGEQVARRLSEAGLACERLTFPPGEAGKQLATIGMLAEELARRGFDRGDALLALGGGVTGDLAGFLASVYMRGIPFVQVPTTLLAQVDSAVGGKTGVDIPQGKNLIGAFYQPRAVVIDTDVLRTLPREEFLGGMAEVIKYGASMDAEFFDWLKRERDTILALRPEVVGPMIHRCCALKASVVERDEREGGLRRILNFGHTVGHAVEAASKYQLIHGCAVAIGMRAAALLAVRSGCADQEVAERIEHLLRLYGLPVDMAKEYDRRTLRSYLLTDKKTVGGRVFFVLPERIGAVRITDQVEDADIDAVLSLCGAGD
ncbi:MAG: 3-dehydroquinate synthase [Desulfobulbus sp.]